ncbi:MAG: hypothetical protein Q9163_004725, partial [Psora crenata]
GTELVGPSLDQAEQAEQWIAEEERAHGFVSDVRLHGKQHVELAVQRACVEIYALKQEQRGLDSAFEVTSAFDHPGWMRLCTKTTFEHLPNGNVVLKFDDEGTRRDIVSSLLAEEEEEVDIAGAAEGEEVTEVMDAQETPSQEDNAVMASGSYSTMRGQIPMTAEEHVPEQPESFPMTAEEHVPEHPESSAIVPQNVQAEGGSIMDPVDQSWRTIPLIDPDLKFAILKRTSQLLGLRVPDPQIASINDTTALLHVLLKKPKPKKLVEEIVEGGRLEGLKNVQVFGKKYTTIDREEELGRLKVIETELTKRGIPVKTRRRLSPM